MGKKEEDFDACVLCSVPVQPMPWRHKNIVSLRIDQLSCIAHMPDVLRRYCVCDEVLVSMVYLFLELEYPYNFL